MFHMMNEARVGVGAGAVALGYTGYLHALDYARGPHPGPAARRQGPGVAAGAAGRAPRRAPHAAGPEVVRRGRRSRSILYCARLVDEERTGRDAEAARDADLLLDLLTPIAKSLAVAVVPGRQRPRHPGARRLRLHARLRRSSSSTATTGSTRSTRAPTGSRPSTCSAARSSMDDGAALGLLGARDARHDPRRGPVRW